MLFALTFPMLGVPVGVGPDASYAFALNHFLAHGTRFGHEVVFTYGPLGALAFPMPVSGLFPWLLLADALLYAALVASLVAYGRSAWSTAPAASRWIWYVAVALALGVMNLPNMMPIVNHLTFLVLALVGLAHQRRALRPLAAAGAIAAVAMLVKVSAGVFCFLAIGAHAVMRLAAARDLRPAVVAATAAVATFLGVWFALYHEFGGLAATMTASAEFSRGFVPAMALPTPLHLGWALAYGACALALPVVAWRRSFSEAWAIVATVGLAWWGYATGRNDHYHLLAPFTIGAAAWLAPHVPRARAAAVLATAVGAIVSLEQGAIAIKRPMPDLVRVAKDTVKYAGRGLANGVKPDAAGMATRSSALLASHVLPEGARRAIGDAPVDVFPWESTYVHANGLNWAPRPVIQTYTAYTPWLDGLDAAHWRRHDAPPYVLWHGASGGSFFESDIGRYLLDDEPKAALAMLGRYAPVGRWGDVLVLRRGAGSVLGPSVAGPVRMLAWNRWAAVPDADAATVLQARVEGLRSTTPFAPPMAWMEIELDDGDVLKRRIVPALAAEGLWVKPLLTGAEALSGRFVTRRPVRVRFQARPGTSSGPLAVSWVRTRRTDGLAWGRALGSQPVPRVRPIPLARLAGTARPLGDLEAFDGDDARIWAVGWAYGGSPAYRPLVVARGATRAYAVEATVHRRLDVQSCFRSREMLDSGYAIAFPTRGMAPGRYRLGLLLEAPGRPDRYTEWPHEVEVGPSAVVGAASQTRHDQ